MKTTFAGKLLLVLALGTLSACGQDDTSQEPAATDANEQASGYLFEEGTHFDRFETPQPTVGDASMIEVTEVFWYGCHHCYNLEAPLKSWLDGVPDNVRFVRIPATWNQTATAHAQIYYTLEVLHANGVIADLEEVHAAVFEDIHRAGNRLILEEDALAFFARFGVEAGQFTDTWNSPEVAELLQTARDLARSYRIEAVPTIVVGGEYRTSGYMAGPELFNVIDELIVREEAAP